MCRNALCIQDFIPCFESIALGFALIQKEERGRECEKRKAKLV